jgi:nicotinamidase-related amidase
MKAPVHKRALLVIDVVNPLDFPGGKQLLAQALPVVRNIARLKRRLKSEGAPVIYVNDNFTHWLSDFRELVAICTQPGVLGAPLAQAVPPEHDDYLVLKPKHSGFFASPLDVLLRQLQVGHVVVTGLSGDGCVLSTAADAHMRDFVVSVPSDCCASITSARNRQALSLLRQSLKLDTRASRNL